MKTTKKRTFYKKWWFATFIVLVIIGTVGCGFDIDTENEEQEIDTLVSQKTNGELEKEALEQKRGEEEKVAELQKKEEERLEQERINNEKEERKRQEEAERVEQERIAKEKEDAEKKRQVEAEKVQEVQDENSDDEKECKIKGSKSKIYHIPGSQYYEKTTNVRMWFCSVEEAQEAGYRAPKR